MWHRQLPQAGAPGTVSLQSRGNGAGLRGSFRGAVLGLAPDAFCVWCCSLALRRSKQGQMCDCNKLPHKYGLHGFKFLWSVFHDPTTLIRGFVSCSFWGPCVSQISFNLL